jgi:uridine kinase
MKVTAISKGEMVTVKMDCGKTVNIEKGTSLLELSREYLQYYDSQIVAAKVNNEMRELGYKINCDSNVEFVTMRHDEGIRVYLRSLKFILIKAAHDLFPDRKVIIQHSISKGMYFEIVGDKELELTEVEQIEKRMREISDAAIPFIKKTIPLSEAKQRLIASGRDDRFEAAEHRDKDYITIYECDGYEDYFYGYMTPDTGFIKLFGLKFYKPGVILRYPDKYNPNAIPEFIEQKKLFSIFSEHKKWGYILGVENVGAVNDIIKEGQAGDLIRISEALHEKKIAQIADMISIPDDEGDNKKIVLISGPSSSGKTTFANRLTIQLRVNGFKPLTISMDDYFVDREKTPLDEDGNLDYESVEAIDVKLFNEHLNQLLDGKEVEIPTFNFTTGKRDLPGKKMKMKKDSILLIEGIHGLNDSLTSEIPAHYKFKIYISALTSLNIDDHNRIPTTDTRLIRRIVRDHQFRGTNAESTIARWPSVRAGEEKNIFPFQESADVMFNSSLFHDLSALKGFAEPLLDEISVDSPYYAEAKRLKEFLGYFLPIDCSEIPANSIIREFIGDSCFYK